NCTDPVWGDPALLKPCVEVCSWGRTRLFQELPSSGHVSGVAVHRDLVRLKRGPHGIQLLGYGVPAHSARQKVEHAAVCGEPRSDVRGLCLRLTSKKERRALSLFQQA